MENIMGFRNKSNICVTIEGNEFWISRSNVVVGFVFAIDQNGKFNVLIINRSIKMTYPHKLCAPCGYLDYNETIYEAMIREVYEEGGLYLPDYSKYVFLDNEKKPIYILDDTFDNKQNISFIFLTILDFSEDMDKFPLHVHKYQSEESYNTRWLNEDEFWKIRSMNNMWAFRHNDKIATLMENYKFEKLF